MPSRHIPAMLGEVIEYLRPLPGGVIVDCTLGGASYALKILEHIGASGALIGLEADPAAFALAKELKQGKNIDNLILYNENFRELSRVVGDFRAENPEKKVSGVVFDLGLSSDQLADRDRGFSFQLDAPLNMSFGRTGDYGMATEKIINDSSAGRLAEIISKYGEEKHADRIAEAIVRERRSGRIETTGSLVNIIKQAVPPAYAAGRRIHCATRTFQALRIATNDELGALESALPQALEVLAPGGRLVAVSYHSLEDRTVKRFLKERAAGCICPPQAPECRCGHEPELKILTKKVITPLENEAKTNPRARSAKLRAAEKTKIKTKNDQNREKIP